MQKCHWLVICALVVGLASGAMAEDQDLVRTAQMELIGLGYDPGNIQGEMSTDTIVAISKFQAEHDLEVTGEVTPQLVGALLAAANQADQGSGHSAATPAPAATSQQQEPADLQARQQACLEEKYAAEQERQKKKRGVMKLLSAVSRSSNQFGGGELAGTISRSANEAYNVNATADDLEQAGKDLGLSPDEMEECRNPPQ